MISYRSGDIFGSGMRTLVNPVNTVGVMGKGLAASFRKRYPEMYGEYHLRCKRGLLPTGKLFLWRGHSKQILCFPTKGDWREPSRLEYIESGLDDFMRLAERGEALSGGVAFPMLGCGLGGLKWADVGSLMEERLSLFDGDVEIYLGENQR